MSAAKKVAFCAVECALLLAVQLALSSVAGVELVTVFLITFSSYFGVWCGVCSAVGFSLLRCFIFGFNPAVIVLYLIYYPLLAATFALLGKTDERATVAKLFITNLLLLSLASLAGVCAGLKLVKVSAIYAPAVNVLLYVVCGICATLCVIFDVFFILVKLNKMSGKSLKLIFLCAVACAFCAAFTLLDDVITPLFFGLGKEAAAAYFYASFTAMLPQIICTAASVTALYYPLIFAYTKACPELKRVDKTFKM